MEKTDLEKENIRLRSLLTKTQRWMRRQVEESKKSIEHGRVKKNARVHIQNDLESEQLDFLGAGVDRYFGDLLALAPRHTRERLIDAEIQWALMQRYPNMDGLALSIAFQKVFDAFVEFFLVLPFRVYIEEKRFHFLPSYSDPLDRDIARLVHRGYHLSSGRLYQFLMMESRNVSTPTGILSRFLAEERPALGYFLYSPIFLSLFGEIIITTEVFSTKRHEKKVSYREAKQLRKALVGNLQDHTSIFYEWLHAVEQGGRV